MQQVLSENRKVIGGDGRQLIYVPMPGGNAPAATTMPPLLSPDLVAPTVNASNNDARPERGERPNGREEATR